MARGEGMEARTYANTPEEQWDRAMDLQHYERVYLPAQEPARPAHPLPPGATVDAEDLAHRIERFMAQDPPPPIRGVVLSRLCDRAEALYNHLNDTYTARDFNVAEADREP